MPKTPLFTTSSATPAQLKTDAEAAFKSIEQQTQNVDIFELLLNNPEFKSSFFESISNAINDPQNVQVKLALAQFLTAYFGLTPTTPIEPIE